MNAEVIECGEAREAPCSDVRVSIAARLRGTVERFPSATKGMLSIFDQAIVSGTSFLTAVIVGRLTSPDQLGLYYLVLSIVLIVTGVQEQLVSAPYMVYSKRRHGRELNEYAGSVWAHHFVLNVLTAVGLLVAILITYALGRTAITPGLWALLGVGSLLFLREAVRRFVLANLHVKSAIWLDAVVAVLQLGGLAVLGYFGLLSLLSIYAVMGAASGVACFAWYWFERPTICFNRKQFLPDWRHNWTFAKWALRSFLVGNTMPYVMLWILGLGVGAAASGVMGACSTLVGLANVIVLGVCNILTPHAAHVFVSGGRFELRSTLLHTAAFLAAILGGFCLVALVTGDWLVVFVFGTHYEGTGAILFTLALSTLLKSLGMVAGNGLWAIDNPRSNFVADVVCMTVTLIAAAILVFPLGVFGAALATLAGATISTVVRTVTLARQLDNGALGSSVATGSVLSS